MPVLSGIIHILNSTKTIYPRIIKNSPKLQKQGLTIPSDNILTSNQKGGGKRKKKAKNKHINKDKDKRD